MSGRWYYFGCPQHEIGHYLLDKNGSRARGQTGDRAFEKLDRGTFDGLLAPRIEPMQLYAATYSQLPGLGFDALAWWDQSADKRSGSNSAIFAPRSTAITDDRDAFLAEARQRFPWVFARLPKPLTWWEPLS